MTTNTTKDNLKALIDQLPDSELYAVRRFLEYLRDTTDPLLHKIKQAPEDDEPETEEEREQVHRSKKSIRSGQYLTHEAVLRELGL